MAKQQTTEEPKAADLATIKAAILSNCGGWNGASDGEYLAKWASLPDDVKAEYLKQPKKGP